MNVTCPQCSTVFRVDPAQVPERGVRARCSVCGGLIAVRRPEAERVAPPVVAVAPPPVAERPAAPVAPATPPEPPPAPIASPVVPLSALPVETPMPPVAPPPVAEPVAPPPRDAAPGAGGRYSNPFLQQDPATRARRLARALVSDLVVYHPEKRQRGLAEGNLKDLFAEEIRKSWEEYTEQVGEDVANTTPYFTEALNEILAEGRKLFG